MKIMVTGGAGFIGSALIRFIINETSASVINVDKITYAGNLKALATVANSERYFFEKVDICDTEQIHGLFKKHQPDLLMHLAAESHVDHSIRDATAFLQTNIMGTYVLLEAARTYWQSLPEIGKKAFRFHHISTDEVYGDLENSQTLFQETTAYAPSSPYSASKASSDHLVRAWHRTYGLPVVLSHCSNNYGPYQYPEKLIPLTILNALAAKSLPVYGDGKQVRDWLYVEDHVHALYRVVMQGVVGETYHIGGHNEQENIEVVKLICSLLEEYVPAKSRGLNQFSDLITYVNDRPGHDRRYGINAKKIKEQLNWQPQESFSSGLRKTVEWYLKQSSF